MAQTLPHSAITILDVILFGCSRKKLGICWAELEYYSINLRNMESISARQFLPDDDKRLGTSLVRWLYISECSAHTRSGVSGRGCTFTGRHGTDPRRPVGSHQHFPLALNVSRYLDDAHSTWLIAATDRYSIYQQLMRLHFELSVVSYGSYYCCKTERVLRCIELSWHG